MSILDLIEAAEYVEDSGKKKVMIDREIWQTFLEQWATETSNDLAALVAGMMRWDSARSYPLDTEFRLEGVIESPPITVELDEDGCYVVSDSVFLVYGTGDTQQEAIDDYVTALVDYYTLLLVRARDDSSTQGGLPPIFTMVSHNKKDIGPKLQSAIARQLRVRRTYFQGMVDCTNGREDYYRQVREDSHPPFDVRF